MPIIADNLDNRTFEDLVEEMRALIPRYAPDWTDHNLSDPGMMLIDLFAWLTEALIYRLNRIPRAGEARFLELLGAAFVPALPAQATLAVTADGLTAPVTISAKTPLKVRMPDADAALAFQTTAELVLDPLSSSGKVPVRQTRFIGREILGVSEGRVYQRYCLHRPHLAFDPQRPHRFAFQIKVDGRVWQYRPNLLASGPQDLHFTLDPLSNAVRFGDGVCGRIPAAGASIEAAYLSTRGLAGNIAVGTEMRFDRDAEELTPAIRTAILSGTVFSMVTQSQASDGTSPTSLSQGRDQAHALLKERWRGVTAEDLETLAGMAPDHAIARAKCVPERDLTVEDPDTPRAGHVSIIVVPRSDDERPVPSPECIDHVWTFLDQRRLMTCRHHVLGPAYTTVTLQTEIVRQSGAGEADVRHDAAQRLNAFFDPYTGGPPEADNQGWPFGRDVHISEVYHLLEETRGVDHVKQVRLYYLSDDQSAWIAAADHIQVPPRNLIDFNASAGSIKIVAHV